MSRIDKRISVHALSSHQVIDEDNAVCGVSYASSDMPVYGVSLPSLHPSLCIILNAGASLRPLSSRYDHLYAARPLLVRADPLPVLELSLQGAYPYISCLPPSKHEQSFPEFVRDRGMSSAVDESPSRDGDVLLRNTSERRSSINLLLELRGHNYRSTT